jgi:hypothetical protein
MQYDNRYSFLDIFLAILIVSGFLLSTDVFVAIELGGAKPENYISPSSLTYSSYFLLLWAVASSLFIFIASFSFKFYLVSLVEAFFLFFLLLCCVVSLFADNVLRALAPSAALLLSSILFIFARSRGCNFYKSVLSLIVWSMLGLLVLSLFLIFFKPGYGISVGVHQGLWQGAFPHKNMFSDFVVLSYLFVIYYCRRNILAVLLLTFTFAFILSQASSATSMALFFFVFLSWLFIAKNLFNRFFLLSIFLLFFIIVVVFSFYPHSESFMNNRGKIWHVAIDQALHNGYLGGGVNNYPYFTMSNADFILDEIGFFVRSTHNGFIDTLYSLGVLSIFVAFFLIMVSYKFSMSSKGIVLARVGFVLLVCAVYANFFESILISFNFMVYLILFLAFFDSRWISNI